MHIKSYLPYAHKVLPGIMLLGLLLNINSSNLSDVRINNLDTTWAKYNNQDYRYYKAQLNEWKVNQTLAQDGSTLRQTLYVSAEDGSEAKTNFSLVAGTIYTIRFSGLWVWGGCDSTHCPDGGPTYIRWGDAAFLTDDHFNHFF